MWTHKNEQEKAVARAAGESSLYERQMHERAKKALMECKFDMKPVKSKRIKRIQDRIKKFEPNLCLINNDNEPDEISTEAGSSIKSPEPNKSNCLSDKK